MSNETPQYKPGDVANGHVLGTDNQWHALAPQAPAGTAAVRAEPSELKPPRKWFTKKRFIIPAVAIFVLILAVAISPKPSADVADAATKSTLPPAAQAEHDAATNSPRATPTPRPTTPAKVGTIANPAPVGTTITGTEYTGATWNMTFAGFNPDATQQVHDTNQFNDAAPAGYHYAIVAVSLTNTSADAGASVRPGSVGYGLTLTDAAGNTYNTATVVLENGLSGQNEIYTGQTANGDVAFLVADSATALVAGSGPVFVRVQ